ncbi:MAG TPA: hypothetical protein PLY51_16330, partial [Microthrixaceae bacterium]|nr:hypothetical protein [Microthrixaceae bacterium]
MIAVATLAVSLLVSAVPLAPAPPAVPLAPAPPAPGVPGLTPEVAALPASSRDLDRVRSARDAAVATLDRDRRELDGTRISRETAQQQQQAEATLLARRRQERDKVDAVLTRQRSALRAVASEWYMTGNADRRAIDPTLGASELAELRRQAVLGDAAAAAT